MEPFTCVIRSPSIRVILSEAKDLIVPSFTG
jgi:hypothetical protein